MVACPHHDTGRLNVGQQVCHNFWRNVKRSDQFSINDFGVHSIPRLQKIPLGNGFREIQTSSRLFIPKSSGLGKPSKRNQLCVASVHVQWIADHWGPPSFQEIQRLSEEHRIAVACYRHRRQANASRLQPQVRATMC